MLNTLARLGLLAAFGRRSPAEGGELTVPGPAAPLTIRRDGWGVPHIDAESPADALFGLGFCHAQDRGFQLELLLRAARGSVAELVGADGLAVDRLSRRVGFRRAAVAQLAVQHPDVAESLTAYVAGVNAGFRHGARKPAHEFALLKAMPTPWEPADVLAVLALQAFGLASDFDRELARWRADGEAADPVSGPSPLGGEGGRRPGEGWSSPTPGTRAGPAISPPLTRPAKPGHPLPQGERGNTVAADRLVADLAAFRARVPGGGWSNAWVVAGDRTATGKPLLATDAHLSPLAPGAWYLAHLEAPGWAVAGGGLVGTPVVAVGHNGFACWGMTAALTGNADLFREELSADGSQARGPAGWEPVEVVEEVIRVKGAADVVERVAVTRRGPVISPLVPGLSDAVSLCGVWLQPHPIRGLLDAPAARSFDQFRRSFAHWPTLPQNAVYADSGGTTGDQRLGGDDDSRAAVIRQELAAATGWVVADCQRLQRDVRSRQWGDLKRSLLPLTPADPDARLAVDLLRAWDGRVDAESPAATVFELWAAGVGRRVAEPLAPNSWGLALASEPERWDGVMGEELAAAVRRLRTRHGPGPAWWAWGAVRQLRPRHPLFDKVRVLGDLFSLPPLSVGGDSQTVQQMGVRPLDPLAPPHTAPGLRAVFDTADWSRCRFALLGGQSGNPLSRHFADQMQMWEDGEGVQMPWTPAEVLRAAVSTLRLLPSPPR